MIQYNNILVAFDGSEHGLNALEVAKKFTLDNHAQLTVIYVHDSPLVSSLNISTNIGGERYLYMDPGPLLDSTHVTPVEEETIVVEDEIPNEIMTIAKRKLVDLDHVVYEKLVGKPAEEIVVYANSNDADVIIIGNRGLSGFKKMIMGSVSDKVTDTAECSVFVVK